MSEVPSRLKTALADRYAIEGELGSGGMATVYLAEDLKHHRKVAVKVLRPELAATLGPERFIREIQIAAGLTHPHILPLHDSGEADSFLYYVMPYIEGESLRDRLDREGKLSVEDGIRLTDQVASALSYAHEQGVVHRDIKPENILLAGDQAIVADFGIARAVQVAGGEKLTGTGLAIGTPAYMSPEQALGQEDVDGRSDVYALGCVVYETVSGHTPFEGSTPQALLAKHAVDTVPGLKASDPAIPVFVERAVEKALAKRPDDRFQSASTFAEALTSGTVVARVGPMRWPRRVLAGAAGLALVAAAGWWLTMAGGPAIERLAVLPFTNLMNDSEREYLVQGMHSALINELGQAGVTVIGGVQSMMRYQNTQMTVREIATELDVDAVIDGSVFRMGDSVRIDARLVDGETEAQLWSQSYDTDVRNVLTLYRDVTRAIANEIQLALTPQVEARLADARPVNPEAYEAYLKGQVHRGKFSSADLETAMQYFELALEKDPDYAPAYVGIAGVWGSRLQFGIVSRDEGRPRQKAAVLKAIELDSLLPEAHRTLASFRVWSEWDWDGGEAAFRRAIELKPNYPGAHAVYSHLLMILGRPDEAMEQIERALELDPFNDFFQAFYGMDLLFARRYDEANAQFQNALKTAPNNPMLHTGLQDAFHTQGRYDEALANRKAVFAADGERELEETLERSFAESGYREAMRRVAETRAAGSGRTSVPPLGLAALFAHAGERERVLEWLEKAYEEHDPNLPYIGVIPLFDIVRDDPRFQDLLRRMNLPQ